MALPGRQETSPIGVRSLAYTGGHMEGPNEKPHTIHFIRKLCARLGEEEVREVEQRFAQYIRIIIKITERTESEKNSVA